jgi:hypothetical protein
MIVGTGLDFMAGVIGSPSSNGTGAYAPANYLALTADTNAPNLTDIVLPGELTAGTLSRAQASYSYTAGTGTFTLSNVFTADRTVVVAKIGVYNASSGGTLVFESLLSTTAPMVSGDQLLVTEVITV